MLAKKIDGRNMLAKKMDYGDDFILDERTLWCHDLVSKDWSIAGYQKLCSVKNISEFWRVFNNFAKIGWKRYHFFFMRKNILPLWEDPQNTGILLITVPIESALEIWELLGAYFVGEILAPGTNGISVNLKGQTVTLKIWCSGESCEVHPVVAKKIEDYPKFFMNNSQRTLTDRAVNTRF